MRRWLALAAAVSLLLGACGGASMHPSTDGSKPVRTTARSAPVPTTTISATAAPSTTSAYPSRTSSTATAGATGVRLPARFTIEPGDRLSPTVIGGPAGVTIDLTMISRDGRAHTVTVAGRTLPVSAGGRASLALAGLQKGNHTVAVDGSRRGTLVVGAQPGP